MIIDRFWLRKNQTYYIFYLDENGNRKCYSKQMHHWKTYEYNPNGKKMTCDEKKCDVEIKAPSKHHPHPIDQYVI